MRFIAFLVPDQPSKEHTVPVPTPSGLIFDGHITTDKVNSNGGADAVACPNFSDPASRSRSS